MATEIDSIDVLRAAQAGAGTVRRTPVLESATLSQRSGATVLLKAENLQRTGSFKVRGALAKIDALGEECARGVAAASAGNHAQAVAYAARARGVRCEVYMPERAPLSKVEGATALGATVHLVGTTVMEALEVARVRAEQDEPAFIHPFDDRDVIAGQGTLGLEVLEQVPDVRRVVVPVGGGGLVSGVAIACKTERPEIEVVGVQLQEVGPYTIADGIAVKQPGKLTLPLIERWVDRLVEVSEDDVAEAMVFLMERAKLVVEGAGAVGVAAVLGGRTELDGTTVVVLSGGNVDPGLLAEVARRHESQLGRRLVLLACLPDRPGSLAQLLALVGRHRANVLDVEHIREGFDLHVRESAIQMVMETRGPAHAAEVTVAVREAGYSEPRLLR